VVRKNIKKTAPGMTQKMGRNSEGDFPLKTYPTQRIQGVKPGTIRHYPTNVR